MLLYRKKQYDEKLEFRTIIGEFIFPYLGIFETDLQYIVVDKFVIQNYFYFFKNKLYFFPRLDSNYGYFIPVHRDYRYQEFINIDRLIKEIMEVSYNQNPSKYNNIEEVFTAYQKVISKVTCMNIFPTNPMLLFNIASRLLSEGEKCKNHPVFSVVIENSRKGNHLTYNDVLKSGVAPFVGEDRKGIVYFDNNGHFIEYVNLNFKAIQNKNVLKDIGLILTSDNDLFITKDGKLSLLCKNRNISGFCYEDFILSVKSNKKTSKFDEDMLRILFYVLFDTMIDSSEKYFYILNEEKEITTGYTLRDYFNNYEIHKILEKANEIVVDSAGHIVSLDNKSDESLLTLHTIKDGRLEIFIDGRLRYNLFKEIMPSK